MNSFQKQMEAIGSALLHIQKLPEGTVWALTCTNDDDAESPSTLNIFVDETEWDRYQKLLHLGKPTDRSTHENDERFICFKQGTLHISFIQYKEEL